MVKVNFKDDPLEMMKIAKTDYCYRFNVRVVDGETKLYPAHLKETRIDETIFSNKHLKDTLGSNVSLLFIA